MSVKRVFAPILLTAFVLAGCTTGTVINSGEIAQSGQASATPAAETIGNGPIAIGLLAFDESGALSDTGVDSVYRAAKMAVNGFSTPPITLYVRRYNGDAAAISRTATEFANAGIDLVIGPNDTTGAARLAAIMGAQGASILSLSDGSDIANGLYAAGFSAEIEAAATVNELARRGFANVVIVASTEGASQDLASKLETAAKDAGIGTHTVSAAVPGQTQVEISALADQGFRAKAIVFAVGPKSAVATTGALATDARLKGLSIVGNSGWATATLDKSALAGAWYAAPNGTMQVFGEKYRQANGSSPTPNAAFVYDLVVLAAALPQIVGEEPFKADVLTNPQGFKGQTGGFKFRSNGQIEREYTIVIVK